MCIVTFLISNMGAHLLAGNIAISVALLVLVIILFLNLAAIGRQPVQKTELSFKVGESRARLLKSCVCVLLRTIAQRRDVTRFINLIYSRNAPVGTSRSTHPVSQYFYKCVSNVPTGCLYVDQIRHLVVDR